MQSWQRRVLGLVTLSGAATGFFMTVASLFAAKNTITGSVALAFAGIFGWGVWCGMRILEGDEGAETATMWYWLIQVPSIESPVFTYLLNNGISVIAKLTFRSPSTSLSVDGAIGSSFRFWLERAGAPWVVGLNFAAAAFVVWLFYRRQQVQRHAETLASPSMDENPEAATATPATLTADAPASSSS